MDEDQQRSALLSVLGTEYFVLQGLSNSTTGEASSRASLYLVSLSSALVSVGIVLGAAKEVFVPFISSVLPVIFLLGIFTIVRLVDVSVENVRSLRGMARIRRYFAQLSPEAAQFFPSRKTIEEDAQQLVGIRYDRFSTFFTMASMVGAMNAVLGGITTGLLLRTVLPTGPSIAASIAAGVVLFVTCLVYQARRYRRGLQS